MGPLVYFLRSDTILKKISLLSGPEVQFWNQTMGIQPEEYSQVYVCWSTCLLYEEWNCFEKISMLSGPEVQFWNHTMDMQLARHSQGYIYGSTCLLFMEWHCLEKNIHVFWSRSPVLEPHHGQTARGAFTGLHLLVHLSTFLGLNLLWKKYKCCWVHRSSLETTPWAHR